MILLCQVQFYPCQDVLNDSQQQFWLGRDVSGAGVNHHLGGDSAALERMVEFISLPYRHARIVFSVQDQGGGGHPVGMCDGGALEQ